MNPAAEQRQARAGELAAAVERSLDQARALELLADQIEQHACPVERWRGYWSEVARDCRAKSRDARRSAALDNEHIALLVAADEARVEHAKGNR